MAIKYWIGGSAGGLTGTTDDENGDFNTAANWSPSGVPASTDQIIFDGRATVVPAGYTGTKHTEGRHYNCYEGMDHGPDDCQGIIVSEDFTGLVGENAAGTELPLEISLAANMKVEFRGNYTARLKIKTDTKTVPRVVHDSATGILALSSVNDVVTAWTLIECYGAGTLEIEDNTLTPNIYNFGTTTIIRNETCPAANIYAIGAGAVYSDSPLGTVEVHAGTFEIGQTSLTAPTEALDVASLKVFGTAEGGVTWRAAGKITAFEQNGGNVSAVGDGAKQIGNSSNVFTVNAGTFDLSGQKGALTFGTTCSILQKGGNVVWPDGTKITAFTTGN